MSLLKVWEIVGNPDANVKHQKVSVTSPNCARVDWQDHGAIVDIETFGGTKVCEIWRGG
jgi:hypothetical protein